MLSVFFLATNKLRLLIHSNKHMHDASNDAEQVLHIPKVLIFALAYELFALLENA